MKYIRWAGTVLVIGFVVFFGIKFFQSIRLDGAGSDTATASTMYDKALPDSAYKTTTMIMQGQPFTALIADSDALQELGLSYRTGLAKNEAMLFAFPDAADHDFWMKDMKFPLDIMWLSTEKKIIYIEKDLSPATYPDAFGPSEDSQYVVEVAAGTADRLGLTVGQDITFSCNGSFCKL